MIRTHEVSRLTADPDIRYAQDGKITSASFTTASDRWSNTGKKSDFVRHIAFGTKAEFAYKYLHKGTKIYIVGHIQTGEYEKDGHKVYTTDIVCDDFEFCESAGEKEQKEREDAIAIDDQAELPFK